jgi:hypothetical protein
VSVVAIVDEVRDGVPLPAGATRDDAAAPPLKHFAQTLYAWAVRETRRPDGTGALDEGVFRLRVEYAAAGTGEESRSARDRATSVALDEAADAMADWVRLHRTGATYEHLQVDAIDYDTLRTLDFRGFALDVSGYRQIG